jgi:protein-S-isoprenylcysteine O-methyltransferase Ste14
MDEEMTLIMQLATGGGVAAIITGMILVFLWPVRTAAIDWIKSKTPQIALLLGVLLLAGCAGRDLLSERELEQAWQAREEDKRKVVSDEAYKNMTPEQRENVIPQSLDDARHLERDKAVNRQKGK